MNNFIKNLLNAKESQKPDLFINLEEGDLFVYENKVYIKTTRVKDCIGEFINQSYNSVALCSGESKCFNRDEKIKKLVFEEYNDK